MHEKVIFNITPVIRPQTCMGNLKRWIGFLTTCQIAPRRCVRRLVNNLVSKLKKQLEKRPTQWRTITNNYTRNEAHNKMSCCCVLRELFCPHISGFVKVTLTNCISFCSALSVAESLSQSESIGFKFLPNPLWVLKTNKK